MASASEVAQGLENASQKQEKEIVIELGSDRILHYIGVYLVLFLAAVSKLSEAIGPNLSCYPAGNVTVESDFISYATSYCWESSNVSLSETNSNGNNNACNVDTNISSENLSKHPSYLKTFLQWMPYGMIIEAFFFALPSVWWHFRVGARLMGHLKFMKILIDDVYEFVKTKKRGTYRKGSTYDSRSYYLDGWSSYDPQYKRQGLDSDTESESSDPEDSNPSPNTATGIRQRNGRNVNSDSAEDAPLDSSKKAAGQLEEVSSHANPSASRIQQRKNTQKVKTKKKSIEDSWYVRLFFGNMRDRNLFSMLCFENFASLEQYPYILSVYKVTDIEEDKKDKDLIGPKTQCILRLVSNQKNMSGRFLIKAYLLKHVFGFLVSLSVLAVTAWVLVTIGSDGWTSESFQCDIAYHEDKCMICTLHRKRDMIAFLVVNLLVNFAYLLLSVSQWIFIRRSENRATCYYLEDIRDLGSVALHQKKWKKGGN
ncbi:uncharacterized protein LOC144422261 [Styela clava]